MLIYKKVFVSAGNVMWLCLFLCSCHDAVRSSSSTVTADTVPLVQKEIDSSQQIHIYPDRIDEGYISKAAINRQDSSFFVYGNIRKDYRIFGYERPDTNSKRMILFSVFTRDVENNPYKCKYGAFYQTASMDSLEIKYSSDTGSFVMTQLYINGRKADDIFFEKKWIEFTD